MEAHPAAVQEVLALMRRAEMIPRGGSPTGRASPRRSQTSTKAPLRSPPALRGARRTRRYGPQTLQPVYIETLCEAADLVGRIERIATPHGVPVYPSSGFDGLKGKRAMGERALDRDVPTVVLHIGDRDDDGDRIYVAAAEDAIAWADGWGRVVDVQDSGTPELLAALKMAFEGTGPVADVRAAGAHNVAGRAAHHPRRRRKGRGGRHPGPSARRLVYRRHRER